MTEKEVTVDVQKNLTQAIIVPQKITREIKAVNDPSINTNPKNPKNIFAIIIQVIIQTHRTTALIQTIVVIHETCML